MVGRGLWTRRYNVAAGRDVPPYQTSEIKMQQQNEFVQRKQLPHNIPDWVPDNAIYFITINSKEHDKNVLANNTVANIIKDSFKFKQDCGELYVYFLLIMPDHLHCLISFETKEIRPLISNMKSFMAKKANIKWQRDFFEHRIRDNVSFAEKLDYIRNNPVRKGLTLSLDEWPYQWGPGLCEVAGW